MPAAPTPIRCADCAHATSQYREPGQVFCSRLRGHRAPLEPRACPHFAAAQLRVHTAPVIPPPPPRNAREARPAAHHDAGLPDLLREQAC